MAADIHRFRRSFANGQQNPAGHSQSIGSRLGRRRRGAKRRDAVTGIVIANFPIIALIVAAMIGIPLWITFKHPHGQPDYSEARAHFRAKAAAEAHTSDFVPTTKVAAFDGLTVARQHLAPRIMVPGRRHATAGPSTRTHPQGTPAGTAPSRTAQAAGSSDTR
jgi:hypothetical protein